MKISSVVVTYNRLTLLKECLNAIHKQSLPVDSIIIIDNNSTDETEQYLTQYTNDPRYKIVKLTENIGGAGGFTRGIKEAVKCGSDWIWLMDDDTIPSYDALEKLVHATSLSKEIGFVSSKVVWTDGMPHKMNTPSAVGNGRHALSFNTYSTVNCPALLVNYASFVSVLINTKAVRKVGLPYSEFFIWMDDSEYTTRIHSNGFLGLYVDNSVVVHKTAYNYAPELETAPADTAWKFYYQARNEFFCKKVSKRKSKLALWFSTMNHYRKDIRALSRRKDDTSIFKKHIRKGYLDGFLFYPQIEYLDE